MLFFTYCYCYLFFIFHYYFAYFFLQSVVELIYKKMFLVMEKYNENKMM